MGARLAVEMRAATCCVRQSKTVVDFANRFFAAKVLCALAHTRWGGDYNRAVLAAVTAAEPHQLRRRRPTTAAPRASGGPARARSRGRRATRRLRRLPGRRGGARRGRSLTGLENRFVMASQTRTDRGARPASSPPAFRRRGGRARRRGQVPQSGAGAFALVARHGWRRAASRGPRLDVQNRWVPARRRQALNLEPAGGRRRCSARASTTTAATPIREGIAASAGGPPPPSFAERMRAPPRRTTPSCTPSRRSRRVRARQSPSHKGSGEQAHHVGEQCRALPPALPSGRALLNVSSTLGAVVKRQTPHPPPRPWSRRFRRGSLPRYSCNRLPAEVHRGPAQPDRLWMCSRDLRENTLRPCSLAARTHTSWLVWEHSSPKKRASTSWPAARAMSAFPSRERARSSLGGTGGRALLRSSDSPSSSAARGRGTPRGACGARCGAAATRVRSQALPPSFPRGASGRRRPVRRDGARAD